MAVENESNIWGQLLSTGAQLGTAAINRNSPQNQSPPPSTAPAVAAPGADWQKFLPLAIGAVVLMVVIGFVFKRK